MRLTVIFEEWLLGDGVYPPLHQGQFVNIALQLQPSAVEMARPTTPGSWVATAEGEYGIVGHVLGVFLADRELPTVALDAGGLRMYIEECNLPGIRTGDVVAATGTLCFDYYWWSESLGSQPGTPDLFKSFRVERLRRVPIPERFLRKGDRSVVSPTRVGPTDWESDRIEEVSSMSDDGDLFDFYLVDLDDAAVSGHSVPKTFIS